jgi:GcrA cell cycle regulator
MMQWTPERVDALARLWAEGLSARQIAEKLGGVTRNAVIGKAHRLNLQRGSTPVIEAPPPPPPPIPEEPRFDPIPDVKSWMCRWPTDDPGRFGLHICGKTCQPGRPYCAEHLTMAYLRKKQSAA